MNWFFYTFFKSKQWISHWLIAYFMILFPQFENRQCNYTAWYNCFDGFYYNALALRYDSVSKVYRDLFSNVYCFDPNQEIYWNPHATSFDKSGLRYSLDKQLARDFLGNHYYWCSISNCYQYSGFWSSNLVGHRLVKATLKPLTSPSVAARVFLLKNSLELFFSKVGLQH